jgi:hypothetical protein
MNNEVSKPEFSTSIVDEVSPKQQRADSEVGSVISSQSNSLPPDDSVVNQIMEDSKKTHSEPNTNELVDDLN